MPNNIQNIVTRPKKPWYSDSVKQQKQVVRKRHGENTNNTTNGWHSKLNKKITKSYNTTKQETLGNEIAECGNTTKKIVLTG